MPGSARHVLFSYITTFLWAYWNYSVGEGARNVLMTHSHSETTLIMKVQSLSERQHTQMNINEQLENLLANLGVEMEEYNQHEPRDQYGDASIPEVSIFQASRDHYGVFYRLDVIDSLPQLRILIPVEQGAAKMEMYLVRMSSLSPLNALFAAMAGYRGSAEFEKGREATIQHLLYAVAELMKHLFWSGDLNAMNFAEEIAVQRIF